MEENKKKYVSIPRNYVNGEDSFIRKYNTKEVLFVHATITRMLSRDNDLSGTINLLLWRMGWDKRKDKQDKLKYILKCLVDFGSIKTDCDFDKIGCSDFFFITYKPDCSNGYSLIDRDIFDKLAKLGGQSNYNKLNVYCFLYCMTYKVRDGSSYIREGKYETCSPSFETIGYSVGLTNATTINMAKYLKENNYIYYENAGAYEFMGKIIKPHNTFTICDRENYVIQVKKSIEFFRERIVEKGGKLYRKKN